MSRFKTIEIPTRPTTCCARARVPRLPAGGAARRRAPADADDAAPGRYRGGRRGPSAPIAPAAARPRQAMRMPGRRSRRPPRLADAGRRPHPSRQGPHHRPARRMPSGDFAGARDGTSADRERYWRADDVPPPHGLRPALRRGPRRQRDPHPSRFATKARATSPGRCSARLRRGVARAHRPAGRRR